MATRLLSILLCFHFVCFVKTCDDGWEKHGYFCFMFSHNKVTWTEAETVCRAFGSHLAEPTTKEIDTILGTKARQTDRKYWLGGSDLQKEGTFKWVTSNMDFTYTNWMPGDPNNALGGEDCLMNNLNRKGQWVDSSCELKAYYVCQKEDDGNVSVVG